MRIQTNLIAVLNVSFFAATFLFGIAACNTQTLDKNDQEKDISELHNETRFPDSSKAGDATFLEESALVNIHEIGLGQLGKDKSKAPEVLLLSKMMIDEHTAASERLKLLADKKNISIPFSAEKNEDESINKLVKEKNASFDKAFADVVVQYHKDAIDKFEAADSVTSDVEIKNYIATILPTLKKHLESAEKIQKGVK